MIQFKKHIILLFLSCHAAFFYSNAQDGTIVDTIYTNEKIDVAVNFYSEILNFYSYPTPSKYRIKSFPELKQLRITTDRKFPAPEHLSVLIKRKTYQFIIAYKKNIDFSNFEETTYNYDEKKIENLIEGRLTSSQGRKESSAKSKAGKEAASNIQSNNDYFSILKQAYEKYKAQDYEDSKALYLKALKMRPDEIMARDGLAQVKAKLEEKEKQTAKLDAVYKGYINEGDKFLKQNKLDEARMAYQQALYIRKDDPKSKQKLAEISEKENLEAQENVKEKNYNTAMASADKAFEHADYKTAQKFYNEAISYFNRKDPNDQLKEIKRILDQQNAEIASSKALKEQKEANDKKEKENQQKQKEYYALLLKADNYFTNGDWDKAISIYNKCLGYKFDDSYPSNQIAKINKIKTEQAEFARANAKKELIKAEKERKEKEQKELENKYNTAIANADKLFNNQKYNEAKIAYKNASGIIKKPWPTEQIKKIDQIELALAAEAKEAKLKADREKAETARFNNIIKSADAYLAKSNYSEAKKQYLNALSIKGSENYPKQKIQFINETLDRLAAEETARKAKLAAEQELNRKYKLAISNGKSSVIKEDFVAAKTAFSEALTLKPGETEAKTLLKETEDKLAEIARINEIENKYDQKKGMADSLVLESKFAEAIPIYQEIHNIKPEESYALSMIKYCNSEIKDAAIRKQQEDLLNAQNEENRKDSLFHVLMKDAASLVSDKNFEEAKEKYKQALKIRPDDSYTQFRIKMCTDQIEMAKEKTIAQNKAKKKSKRDRDNKNQEIPVLQADTTDIYKPKPLPYSNEELATKYPGINFNQLPSEQLLDDNFSNTADNLPAFKAFLAKSPDLSISTQFNQVNIICQGIDFVYQTAYFKFLIRNDSKEDFLTGPMMLAWTRPSGTQIKLYPVFLFPKVLPILPPGSETILVYGCNAYKIGSGDKLNFEISDRLNKTKLSLEIKGSVYERAFTAY